ncbi:MAG: metallophosphoesterase [Opitutaceae bacterium]
MAPGLTRILSDLHYGDHAGRLRRLEELDPLLEGVEHLVLNGDSVDTRPAAQPGHAQRCRAELLAYCAKCVPRFTLITGNHDPDLSPCHHLDLAGGEVFVVHGDILYPSLVPWSRDAPVVRRRLREALRHAEPGSRGSLAGRVAAFRRVAASLPQRHPAGLPAWRALLSFLADTVWPPHRAALILHAWLVMPARAARLARRHRPAARCIVTGHTHYPGCWRPGSGPAVINTGSFTRPLGALTVDLRDGALQVRRIDRRNAHYHPGRLRAEIALAGPARLPER